MRTIDVLISVYVHTRDTNKATQITKIAIQSRTQTVSKTGTDITGGLDFHSNSAAAGHMANVAN